MHVYNQFTVFTYYLVLAYQDDVTFSSSLYGNTNNAKVSFKQKKIKSGRVNKNVDIKLAL